MSHQTAIANGTPNITAITRRKVCCVPAVTSGGMGTAMVISRLKMEPAARKPAKTRIDMRAQERRRKSPTEVQMPMPASAANIAAPAITNCALLGGWGFAVSMNRDAVESTASSSARMLPIIATIALAVTPTGLLMQITYFFILLAA